MTGTPFLDINKRDSDPLKYFLLYFIPKNCEIDGERIISQLSVVPEISCKVSVPPGSLRSLFV